VSSLLQHHGCTTKPRPGYVELLMYLVEKGPLWEKYNGPDSYDPSPDSTTFAIDKEPISLQRDDGTVSEVAKLYRVWRKPRGMFGCWVVFKYNGAEHVPDLSVPIAVFKLPRDAEPLTEDEMRQYWFTP